MRLINNHEKTKKVTEKQNKRSRSLAIAIRARKAIAHNTSHLTTHSVPAETNHHRAKTKILQRKKFVFVSPMQKSSVATTKVDKSNA